MDCFSFFCPHFSARNLRVGSKPSECAKLESIVHRLTVGEEREYSDAREDCKDQEQYLNPALRKFACNRASVSVDNDLKRTGAVHVAQKPNRDEDMFESLPGIVRADGKVA